MKEKYEDLDCEIVRFETSDVNDSIITSGNGQVTGQ